MAKTDTAWADALAKAGCYRFLEPVAAQALDAALVACPGGASLLTDCARKDLLELCLSRLGTIYERSILANAIKRAGFTGLLSLNAGGDARAAAMQAAAQGVSEELARDNGASLRAILPLAEGYEHTMAANFANALAEFLERLLLRRDEVSQVLLEGRPITRVTGFPACSADPHRHGRMVMRIDSDAGSFYYKPHDCRLDVLYLELVGAWLPDAARAAKLVPGDGYAFVEELVPQNPASEGELRTYWQNFGCLAALFHCLGSRDMTQDNIMCCGTRPAALDLETLLAGSLAFDAPVPAGNPELADLPGSALATSVFSSSILPTRMNDAYLSPLVADNPSGSCLPRLRGEQRTVSGFEQDFCTGFEEGYRRLMQHRTEVLAALERYGDARCRQILLNTWAYSNARSLLFSPKAMRDPSRRSEVLDELNALYRSFGSELGRAAAKPDAAALLEGDIPYYCSRADSRMLYANDEDAIGELLEHSALEVARHRLERLSEEELDFELDLIRRSLTAYASFGGKP